MPTSKLLRIVNTASDLGQVLFKVGGILSVLSLIPFGVAVVADQIIWRREREMFDDVED